MDVKAYVDEDEVVRYVAGKLNVTHAESERMYGELGGYNGGPVSFSTRWPDEDPFSLCVQSFMTEKGLTSLQAQYDD